MSTARKRQTEGNKHRPRPIAAARCAGPAAPCPPCPPCPWRWAAAQPSWQALPWQPRSRVRGPACPDQQTATDDQKANENSHEMRGGMDQAIRSHLLALAVLALLSEHSRSDQDAILTRVDKARTHLNVLGEAARRVANLLQLVHCRQRSRSQLGQRLNHVNRRRNVKLQDRRRTAQAA